MQKQPDRTTQRPLVIEARFEWNLGRDHVVWSVRSNDGTESRGFAKCHADAMRDAAAFVEAHAQPRAGGIYRKPELKVINWQ